MHAMKGRSILAQTKIRLIIHSDKVIVYRHLRRTEHRHKLLYLSCSAHFRQTFVFVQSLHHGQIHTPLLGI